MEPKNGGLEDDFLFERGLIVIFKFQVCQGLNSHYFHIVGDGKLNPIVGVYIPIIRIPIESGMTIPNIATFDHGTCKFSTDVKT